MGLCSALLILTTGLSARGSEPNDDDVVRASIVKVSATQRRPDLQRPWSKRSPSGTSGTGFIVSPNRILTNAHVVEHATQIYVQADRSDEQIDAKVEAVSHSMDLALLKLDDDSSLADRKPLVIDDRLPKIRSDVSVFGYPIGGDQISVTKGIVSRVEYTSYGEQGYGLRTQIDAAINPGNSGGPAVTDGKVVGVAFSGLGNADNIGYLIPGSEVRLFLDDLQDGKYDGKPFLWHSFQTVENPALRRWLKLPKSVGGMMVTELKSLGSGELLRVGDVITKIGEHPIDSQGNVDVDGMLLSFRYYSPLCAQDGLLPISLWRDEKEMSLSVPVATTHPQLTPFLNADYPSYFIYGPITFEAVYAEYILQLAGSSEWSTYLISVGSPLTAGLLHEPNEEVEQLVVIPSPPFSHPSMKGYSPMYSSVVKRVNGIPIRSLRHLVEILRDTKEPYLKFEFGEIGSETIVLDRSEVENMTEEILVENNIRRQYSEDMETIWKGK